MKTKILSIAMLFAALVADAQRPAGRDIMQLVKDRPDGDTRYSRMVLTLEKKNGAKRERRLESWAMDVGRDVKKIMYFTYPGDVRGTGFLTWDYDEIGRDDDKWLYLPAMKKTRRISGSSSKTDYFMGTDFTYDDMGDRNVDEDVHTLLREEERDGRLCWVVESVPVDRREIYSRKVTWVAQDCLTGIRVEYYDKLGALHRVLTVSEITRVQGFWTKHRMEMENVQTGHRTVIVLEDPQYDLELDAGLFTVAELEKGL